MDIDSCLKIAPVFRRKLRPKPDSPDMMMTLAPELRYQVYDHALTERFRGHGIGREPPLLRTCKQIRHEAMPVFYKKHQVFCGTHLDSTRFVALLQKIAQVISVCGPAPFMKFKLHFIGSVWEHLQFLLPLLELMRSTRFEPADQEYQPMIKQPGPGKARSHKASSICSIFSMQSDDHGVLQEALERLVALGSKAQDSGWSKETLATEFATAAKEQNSRRGREVKGTRKPSWKGR